jgi:hypothetical protein
MIDLLAKLVSLILGAFFYVVVFGVLTILLFQYLWPLLLVAALAGIWFVIRSLRSPTNSAREERMGEQQLRPQTRKAVNDPPQ